MNKLSKIFALGVLACGFAGLVMSGCKSAPELSRDRAQALIQAQYDHQTPSGITITVDNTGLRQGLAAGYWKLTKVYPNQRWADYTLTDAGKKVLKLAGGGDVIQWRPDSGTDFNFLIVTTTANTLKAKDVQDPQDEMLPDVPNARGASFTEAVNMDGVPQPLQEMAHNPGNRLSSKRQADFSLDNGQWKVHGIV
ncbi:MAG TPA: hypothetical protein VKB38_05800 [Terracidiphilus sp.]|nr:hypothetical protein [Terracidiphilus sp.]